jgi:hypothetical protein
MTSRGSIRQSDLLRIFRAAKAAGSTVQIDPSTFQVTVFPFSPPEGQVLAAIFSTTAGNEWEVDDGLESWDTPTNKTAKGNGGVRGNATADELLKEWYDQIGFDPKTMNETDRMRLLAEADARWRAEIPSKPMTKLEQGALLQLLEYGKGVEVHWRKIKGCGPETESRLDARGFIELRAQKKFPDRIEAYVLTQSGYETALKISSEA